MPTTNPSPAFLIDTNVLLYAYDAAELDKRGRAIEVLARLADSGLGTLSVQVLSEFYTNVTRKPAIPLTVEQARDTSIRLCRSWPVIDLSIRAFLEAVQAVSAHSLSFWDALIWATAKQNGVGNVLTEDQQHMRLVEGIRYLDPFDARFDLAVLS